jgi:LmbE family N-acetylglucosaminyl deacetylase
VTVVIDVRGYPILLDDLTCALSSGDSSDASTGLRKIGSERWRNGIAGSLGRYFLCLRSTKVSGAELGRSAIVFAPHPDDESLGCGGTIIKKKMAGASVKVVYLTDGGASHTLLPKEQLTMIRRSESLKAGRILGVDDSRFLDFEDHNLSAYRFDAIDRVTEILDREKPEEIFVPYCREPLRQALDHRVANDIVAAALQRLRRDITVWEYPVWFWLHWPWLRLRQRPPLGTRHVAWNSLLGLFGMHALLELKHSVYVGDVMERKRIAIAQHKSQMEELIPESEWMTLGRVCAGEFLHCFDQEHEFFRRYRASYRGPHSDRDPDA